MKIIYRASIIADKYPLEFTFEAGSWKTAAYRAVDRWAQSQGKGSRSEKLTIRLIKSTNGHNSEKEEEAHERV